MKRDTRPPKSPSVSREVLSPGKSKPPGRMGNWAFRLVLFFLSLSLALIFVEIYLRIYPPRGFRRVLDMGHILQPDDFLGHSLKPNIQDSLLSEGGEGYRVETNELGLRDHPYTGKQGRHNILGLGDSFLFGEGVDQNKTMLDIIQNILEEQFPGKYRTINAGVPGYATNQEMAYYATRGERLFDTDIVMVFFFINDVVLFDYTDKTHEWEGVPLPNAIGLNIPSQGESGLPEWRTLKVLKFWEKSREHQNAGPAPHPKPTSKLPIEASLFNTLTRPKRENKYANLKYLCSMLREKVKANGAELMFVYVPAARETEEGEERKRYHADYYYHPSRWDWDYPSRRVEEVIQSIGIPFINLIPAFREHWRTTGRSLYFNGAGHLTEEGHHLAAQTISPILAEQLKAKTK